MSPESTPPIPVGTIIGGKFRVTAYLGSGGMARVYEAENVDIGKRVAVKVLSKELTGSRTVSQRFIREARAAARIRSPYICDVFDVGEYQDQPFLVMELLEGESLYDLLARERRLKPQQTYQIASQVARGLQKAHDEGIVHRDLKPENVFLARSDEHTRVAKIVDFGLAKFHEPNLSGGEAARLTRDGALFGTPAFMSPEQAEAKGAVGFQSDLWSLGCIVYEMLTGRTVWNVEQGVAMILAQIASGKLPIPSKARKTLPPEFDAWFARALAKNPEERFASATEFADQLKLALGLAGLDSAVAQGIPLPPPPRPQTDSPPAVETGTAAIAPVEPPRPSRRPALKRRHLTWITAGGVAVIVAIAAGVIVERTLHPTHERPDPSLEAKNLPPPAETADFAKTVHTAQELLATEPEKAVEQFKAAFDASSHKAARSLFSQSTAAVASTSGPCKLTALGHPRPFDTKAESSKPSLQVTRFGAVAVWADNHEVASKRQVFSTLLDTSLRRVYPVVSVTPEITGARQPQLFRAGNELGLLYWENSGATAGVYVRRLTLDGKISSPPILLSKNRRASYFPSLAPAEDGGYWTVWSEPVGQQVSDLVARRLSSALEPQGDPVRLTAYAPSSAFKTIAGRPVVAARDGLLHVAFSLERYDKKQIFLLRTNPDNAQFTKGGVQAVEAPLAGTADEENDRFLGQVLQLSPTPKAAAAADKQGKVVQPDLACTDDGCFVAWDDQGGGAWSAFVEHRTGEIRWRKEFAPSGSRAALGQFDDEVTIAWYDAKRMKLASVGVDGLGEPSILGRVSSPRYEASPQLVAGSAPGEWYVTWRDYEAAVHEPFVLRANCGKAAP